MTQPPEAMGGLAMEALAMEGLAMEVLGDQSPLTGSSVSARELKLSPLEVHHQSEGHALTGADPGPAGFDFVLPDDESEAEALWVVVRDIVWRRAVMNDD